MCIHHDVLRVKIGGLKVPDGNTCPLQLRSRHSIDGNSLRCCNQNTHYDTPPCEILQELTRLLVIEYLARDLHAAARPSQHTKKTFPGIHWTCLLYTSDAADDLLCVDLGGRRIIKKKTKQNKKSYR